VWKKGPLKYALDPVQIIIFVSIINCCTYIETKKSVYRNEKLGLKLVHATGNGTRIIPVPAQPAYNTWNSLAIR
jgi:hypothetical protein